MTMFVVVSKDECEACDPRLFFKNLRSGVSKVGMCQDHKLEIERKEDELLNGTGGVGPRGFLS